MSEKISLDSSELKIELYGKLCDKHFLRKYGKPK